MPRPDRRPRRLVAQQGRTQHGVLPGGGDAVVARGGEDEVGLALELAQRSQPGQHLEVVGHRTRPPGEAGRLALGVRGEVEVRRLGRGVHLHVCPRP